MSETLTLDELKQRARSGDAEALRVLRERGFFDRASRRASYVVSAAQRRLWILDQMNPDSASYNIPGALRLIGALDVAALERTLHAIVERHESLRTGIEVVDGEPRQVVHLVPGLPLDIADVSGDSDPPARARERIVGDAAVPFRLDRAPLVRAALTRIGADDHILSFVIHHIVADAWSLGILLRETVMLYEAFAAGGDNPLEPLRTQYKDVAAWQQQRIDAGALDASRAYWVDHLSGEVEPADLPVDRPRPAVQTFTGDNVSAVIDGDVAERVAAIGRARRATLYMTLFAAVRALLFRYTGQSDIVIGTPVSGRTHPDVADQIGFYVNLLPLRVTVEPAMRFLDLLDRVARTTEAAYEHQDHPFDRLVDELDLAHDVSRSPLFDVLMTLDEEEDSVARIGALRVEPFDFPHDTAKYDLTFFFTRGPAGLRVTVNFNRHLFHRRRMEYLLRHLQQLLAGIAASPETSIAALPIASHDEPIDTGGTATAPAAAGIADVFAALAASAPHAVAVVSRDRTGERVRLTYRELNERADGVARALAARGIGLEDRVGVLLERSERVPVALVGILKAGACYVPLDPAYPRDRLDTIIAGSGCTVVLTDPRTARQAGIGPDDTLGGARCVDPDACPTDGGTPPVARATSRNLAYVMYTSGSTGEPKGTLVEQQSVLRLVLDSNFVQLGPADRVLQTGSLAFDASTFEIWAALLNGARVCFAPSDDLLVASRLRAVIAGEGITCLWLTASLLNELVESDERPFAGVRCLLTGGERLSPWHINLVRRRHPDLVLINGYGPTENTTFTTTYRIDEEHDGEIPIGTPISATSVHILDEAGNPCPVGVKGEICTGGRGLARGYLNRPELTAERFVPHPFADGERLYRTGDLGRWRWDGVVEYLGRRDRQIKLRGYRVELTEIEATLLRHPLVTQAAVTCDRQADGTQRLTAYFVGRAEQADLQESRAVRDFLASALPGYMVPSRCLRLERLPLTPNGKVDRAALAAAAADSDRDEAYEEPRGEVERTLSRIWSDVLQVPRVGAHDSFFDLGGHSLKATRVVARIHRELTDALTLRDIFLAPTLRSLAERIGGLPARRQTSIPKTADAPDYPVSHAQRQLWLTQRVSGDAALYNIPGAVRIGGALDRDRLAAAFSRLVARHESLRTSFVEIEGEPRQRVHAPFAVEIPLVDLCAETAPELEARRRAALEAARPFSLDRVPLFRLTLYRLGPDRHVLFFNLHHIVTDGWSMRVLSEELFAIYGGGLREAPAPLAIQYRDYAAWEEDELRGGAAAAHRRYWLDRFAAGVAPLDLPADYARPPVQSVRGGAAWTSLDAATVGRLRRLAADEGATLFMVFLALVRVLLHRHSNQQDFVIGTPVSGRSHLDLDSQIGFYVNMLALRDRVEPDESFVALLRRTREHVSSALEHQHYPFGLLLQDLQIPRDPSRSPLFDVAVSLEDVSHRVPPPPGVHVDPFPIAHPLSKFDLTFAFSLTEDGGCAIALEYAADLFRAERIDALSGHLVALVASVLGGAATAVRRLGMTPAAERQRLLGEWAEHPATYPRHQTVASLFEEQAARTPDGVAVAADDRFVSYRELNERANRIAHRLRAVGLAPEQAVGTMLERTEQVPAVLLAILKAGGCYVPLDTLSPRPRLEYMIADAGCDLVLGDAASFARVGLHAGARFAGAECIDIAAIGGADPSSIANPPPVGDGRSVAYVIYTSGSTGEPKGTLIEQRSILRLACGTNFLQLGADDVVLQTGSIAFDASTFEIWGPLLNGGRVVFARWEHILQPGRLRRIVGDHGVTVMFLTTSLFNQIVEGDEDAFTGVRCLLTGGERASIAHLNRVRRSFPALRLLHVYGPTENTTFTTYFPIEDEYTVDVPIGYPLANTSVYVLDPFGDPCPVGIAGEICTGGDGLARGYLNRPELTADVFVPHPFDSGARLYRTGDIGRRRFDGAVEFLGRRDAQVKVRGFRIEPAEIEAHLLQHPDITAAAVVARETAGGTRELAAYCVCTSALASNAIRDYLAARLPAYMVPSAFHFLPSLPLNPNGKIDRQQLPSIRTAAADEIWAAPEGEAEQVLAEVWAAVLDRPKVGRDDDYFESGGDSIRAIQIVNRLRKLGWSLALRDLFSRPRLCDVAQCVSRIVAPLPAAASAATGPIPLTPIQRWFFTHAGELRHFNQSIVVRFREPARLDILGQVVAQVVAHHQALRLAVSFDADGRPAALCELDPSIAIGLHVEPLDAAAPPDAWHADADARQIGFDLARGPLFSAVLYRRADGDRLLLAAHHLVVDGVSWRIILDDLEHGYQDLCAGRAMALTPQLDSYAGWAAELDRIAQANDWTAGHAFWSSRLAEAGARVPRDRDDAGNTYERCASVDITLSAETTRGVIADAHGAFATNADDILLTALARALAQAHGQRATWIALEGHGRDLLKHVDVSGAVGWFTNRYPFLLELADGGPAAQVRAVKEALRAFESQSLAYHALRSRTSQPSLAEEAPCQISFNYMGQLDATTDRGLVTFGDDYAGSPIAPSISRDHDLDVGAVVSNGRLTLSITFNRGLHDEATVAALVQGFARELDEVVAFCRSRPLPEKTPTDFTACPLTLDQYDRLLAANRWSPAQVDDVHPLSSMQEGLLFQSLFDRESRAYFLQLNYQVRGAFDVDRFRRAWDAVARRHPALRAAFVHEGVDRPLQIILRGRVPEILLDDVSDAPEEERERCVAAWRERDMARGFDLQHDPLMRMVVIRLSATLHHVVWSYHHVLLDGWSLGVLYRDFQQAYGAAVAEAAVALPPAPAFAEYVRWLLDRDDHDAREYWREYLAGFDALTAVPREAPPGTASRPADRRIAFDPDRTSALAQFALDAGVTLNTVMQAIWAVLLSSYSAATDVTFGAVVSGRPSALPGVEEMVGLFINTVPVRVRLESGEPIAALAGRIQQGAVDAERFHFYPLADIQALGGRRALFDHVLTFENYPIGSRADNASGGTDLIEVEALDAHDRTHYHLDVTIVPGRTLDVRFNYDGASYTDAQIDAMASHVERAVDAVIARPDLSVADIWSAIRTDVRDSSAPLTEAEQATLLALGSGERATYPLEQLVAAAFEAHAAARPTAVAVRHGGVSVDYATINARANQIAHALRAAGVGRGAFVAIVERRGADLVAAMFGVLKAGGAFVPIDPDYPAARIQFMIGDSGAAAVVTRTAVWERLAADAGAARLVWLDGSEVAEAPTGNPVHVHGPRDIAYLLYTSGSTGTPKGALVRHDAMTHHIYAEADLLGLDSALRFLQSAPSSSDISVWQLLGPGVVGGRTVIVDAETVADPAQLREVLVAEAVTLVELVPVVMQGLLDDMARRPAGERALPALRCAMVTGEAVPVSLVNAWLDACPRVPLVNAYGPTEAADDVCQHVMTGRLPDDSRTVPIGRPLPNLRLYVLDDQLRLLPVGATGEIGVSGIAVGAGYRGDAGRTAAAFVPNPYARDPLDAVLYRTGDLGRWRADGTLECLGRRDQQIKVRGHRVEAGEIEERLLAHPGVTHAVAGTRVAADAPALVAWIVGDAPVAELRDWLRRDLPEHMVPSFFVRVGAMPLAPSGKLDRRALPDPAPVHVERSAVYSPPRTPTERKLAEIWRGVLDAGRIGRHDRFFELGGHSLKAMQAVSRIHRDLGVRVSLQEFFAQCTIAELAALVDGTAASPFSAIQPQPAAEHYALSHAQKRLWLMHQLEGHVAYNMPEAFVLEDDLEVDTLRRAFAMLVARHEALRTAFILVDGMPRQKILDAVAVSIDAVDLTAAPDADEAARQLAAAQAAAPFDLTAPPLLRVVVYRLAPRRHVVLLVIHHIIGDGWSMNVLYREILALYAACRAGRPEPLRPLRIQYKDFADWQNRRDFSVDQRFWLDALAGVPDRLRLPHDRTAGAERDFAGHIEERRLSAAQTTRLRAIAATHQTTVSNVVLALFQLFLFQWTRERDICVGLSIANRNHPDVENLIGFFVNILPIRVQLSNDMEFADLLAQVKAATTAAFEHQDYPFDLLIEALNPGRAGNQQPLLNVIYAFQNFQDVAIDIGARETAGRAAAAIAADTVAPAISAFPVPFETSKFDLTLFVTDEGGQLLLSLEYDTNLFRRDTIGRCLSALDRFAGMVE